ncbi:MAG: DUF1080 domain-containing protein [Puniceicoccales bacterium]|jgi:hypothetical protein|nr:DUF1080 domain-containing protein [Puniceicoccales bacterium]
MKKHLFSLAASFASTVASTVASALAITVASLGFAAAGTGSAAAAEPVVKDGWLQLFNGKDLDGWTPKIRGFAVGENFGNTFRVADGVLQVRYDSPAYEGKFKERYGHLFYKTAYSRYILRAEYRFVGEQLPDGPGWAKRNNGLMIHGQTPETMALNQSFPASIEVQLLGGGEKGQRPTANLCTPGTNVVVKDKDGKEKLYTPHGLNSKSPTFRGDQWVTVEVEVHGSEQIIHRVNGVEVMRYYKPQYDPKDSTAKPLIAAAGGKLLIERGTISIQSESAPTDFRKIELKVLE